MHLFEYALFAAGFYPLYRGWSATRGASMFAAAHWAMAAWIAWGVTLAGIVDGHPNPATFVALCLTACAGVAVLGARRPHVGAWNFVVLALLAAMLLPLLESMFLGARTLDGVRIGFLAITLAVGIINYLPTRFGPAAFLLAIGCAGEMIAILAPQPIPPGGEDHILRLCWLTAPWLALVRAARTRDGDEMNVLWRDFRDRWGLVWAQRVREQFNRAAANAGWPATLTWFGVKVRETPDALTRAAMRDALLALLQRFIRVDVKK